MTGPSPAWRVLLRNHAPALQSDFWSIVGETPLAYLTRWRMFIAVKMLRDRQRSLVDIATAVGYESSAAFSKAFQKQYSTPPGRFRAANGE